MKEKYYSLQNREQSWYFIMTNARRCYYLEGDPTQPKGFKDKGKEREKEVVAAGLHEKCRNKGEDEETRREYKREKWHENGGRVETSTVGRRKKWSEIVKERNE